MIFVEFTQMLKWKINIIFWSHGISFNSYVKVNCQKVLIQHVQSRKFLNICRNFSWNFIDTVKRLDCHDYVGEILNQKMYKTHFAETYDQNVRLIIHRIDTIIMLDIQRHAVYLKWQFLSKYFHEPLYRYDQDARTSSQFIKIRTGRQVERQSV